MTLAGIEITEVGPRDGIQAMPAFIPTERKVRLVRDLVAAGLRDLEVASFVDPERVPQMRDGAAVLAALPRQNGVRYAALVPNRRGLDAALAAGVHRVSVLTAASETFQKVNLNASVRDSVRRAGEVAGEARAAGVAARGYVSCMVECPYEGSVRPARVAALAEELLALGCDDVFLGDTVGRGTPATVAAVLSDVLRAVPAERLGVHLHDTYGQALANLVVCVDHGIRRIDTSVAGLGGCPFAPGAAGNVATEDVVYWLGPVASGEPPDLARIAVIGAALCEELGVRNESRAGRALLRRRQPEPPADTAESGERSTDPRE